MHYIVIVCRNLPPLRREKDKGCMLESLVMLVLARVGQLVKHLDFVCDDDDDDDVRMYSFMR